MFFRGANTDDANFIFHTQALPAIKEFVSPATKEEIATVIADSDQAFLIGLSETDNPVGYAHLRGFNSKANSLELFQLAVAHSNNGHGRTLIQTVINQAFTVHKANRLWLDVFPQNARARKLYLRNGFVEEGLLRDAYLWNGKFQSTIVMAILASDYFASLEEMA